MRWPIVIQGREVSEEDMGWLCGWIGEHADWSRRRLAGALCEHWDWRDGSGRLKDLAGIANNTRFLIFPWVRVPHLASHLLGAAARRINRDWQEKYGQRLEWLEIFVERGRFTGTCYKAANWVLVGGTRGRGRQDRNHAVCVPEKDVWLLPLKS